MRLPHRYHWYRAYRLIVQALTCVLFGAHSWGPQWWSDEELAALPEWAYLECVRCGAQKLLKGQEANEVYLPRMAPDPFSCIPAERD